MDLYVGRSLDLYGEYSEAEVTLFIQLLRPGSTAIDAGANIGALTVPIARRVGPSGRVFAYEPQYALSTLLADNLAANGLSNVDLRSSALGARKGTVHVPHLDYSTSNNFGGVALGGRG